MCLQNLGKLPVNYAAQRIEAKRAEQENTRSAERAQQQDPYQWDISHGGPRRSRSSGAMVEPSHNPVGLLPEERA